MRTIIVVTAPPRDYKLWSMAEKWDLDPTFEQAQIRVALVGADQVLVLCQAKSNKTTDYEALTEIRSITTPWVYALANADAYCHSKEVYVAAHHLFVDLPALPLKINDNRYAAGAYFHHSSEPHDQLFADLLELFEQRHQDAFEIALETIVRGQVLSFQQRLAALKFQLAYVFLPVRVDLHAWCELEFTEEYMNEILKASLGSDERLDRARSLVYERGAPPGGDTIEKLVKDAELEDASSWRAVQALLPWRDPRFYQKRDVPPFSTLDSLQDKEKLKALRARSLADDQPFAEWTNQLDAALTELDAALTELGNEMD
jgi:hypothetical protein